MEGKVKADAATSRTAALATPLLLLLLTAGAASAATITVDDNGGVVDACDCTYLARAITWVQGYEI